MIDAFDAENRPTAAASQTRVAGLPEVEDLDSRDIAPARNCFKPPTACTYPDPKLD